MGFFNRNKPVGEKGKTKKKAFLVFTTVGDAINLLVSFIYVAFVVLSMAIPPGFGDKFLNAIMLGITIPYMGFFVVKIIFLNTRMQNPGKVKRVVKISKKYVKLAIRIINAAFITLTMINAHNSNNDNTFAMIGVMVVAFTFIFTVLWDIGSFFIRKKVHDFAQSWAQLSHEEKAERVEHIVTDLIRNINNAAIIDDYFDVALNIKRLIDGKLNDRVRLAEARRADSQGEVVLIEGEHTEGDVQE